MAAATATRLDRSRHCPRDRSARPVSEAWGKLERMRTEELLDFERAWPRHSSHKESAIRDNLGIAPARFYSLLHRAAASHEGLAHDPFTAHRILRRRRVTSE